MKSRSVGRWSSVVNILCRLYLHWCHSSSLR